MKKAILITIFLLLAGLVQAQPAMPTGPVSIESYAYPGYLMTARNVGWTIRNYENSLEIPDTQWIIIDALTGTEGNITFESVLHPGAYARHSGHRLQLNEITPGDTLGEADASWTPVPGLADPTNPNLVSFKSENFGFENRHLQVQELNGSYIYSVIIDGSETPEELARATFMFSSPDPTLATDPYPANRSDEISIDVGKLTWTPGEDVTTHNVFMGTDVNSVTNATVADPMGTTLYQDLDVNNIDLARLEFGTTYYWRVDETPGNGPGKVWDFETEPEAIPLEWPEQIADVTAYTPIVVSEEQEPNMTCNESGLDNADLHSNEINTMWLGYSEDPEDPAWIQYEFDKVYKFLDLIVWNYNEAYPSQDYGAKDVNVTYSLDGENWNALDSLVEFQKATGEEGYAANTVVDMNNAVAKYIRLTFLSSWTEEVYTGGLSEIRFMVIPTRATEPDPEDEDDNIAVDQLLSWKPGRDVAVHKVYIGTDANSVRDGIVDIVEETLEPNLLVSLDLGKTYYWKVDEVNEAEDFTTWDGPVWSFETADTLLIEGFEQGYNATDANAVWMTWIDGYNIDENGAEIGKGLDTPGLSGTEHSGNYSAPVTYDNTGSVAYSEVKANSVDLPIGRTDWSIGSPTALVIWFSGEPNNTPARLYVKLNNTVVLYDGDPTYLAQSTWRPFVIDLSEVSVNLANITSITIGLKDDTGIQDGKGVILIDDIALYGVAPEIAEAVDPGTVGLIASYSMENNVNDGSGNGLNGTIAGTPVYVQGPAGYGKALQFNGTTDWVDLGNKAAFNPAGSFSVSLWANISAWSTNWGHVMIGNRGEDNVGWQLRRYSNNNFCFTTRGVGDDDSDSDANPPLNEWIHITCVYDSVAHTKSTYFNGILDNVVTLNDPDTQVAPTTHNTYIGARALADNSGPDTAAGILFTGILDEIRIYDRALSAGEAVFLSDPTP